MAASVDGLGTVEPSVVISADCRAASAIASASSRGSGEGHAPLGLNLLEPSLLFLLIAPGVPQSREARRIGGSPPYRSGVAEMSARAAVRASASKVRSAAVAAGGTRR